MKEVNSFPTISACLVVYHEEKIIKRCLDSIKDLVDEIIIVHDGECHDRTLEIAKKYTNKIFIRQHIGIAEPHRTFSYEQAVSDWILQIDADEFIDKKDIGAIKELLIDKEINGYWFQWEMWNGKKSIRLPGLIKLFLFRKNRFTYQGLPQTAVTVLGKTKKVDLLLHHQPLEENISWRTANKKRKYWLQSHVKYFFSDQVEYYCLGINIDSWLNYLNKVKKNPWLYILWYPLKNFLGQLKNGLWRSWVGFNIALQQYVYYLCLYWQIWKLNKKLK